MYCFYDKNGIVGEYVFYYLKALKEVSEFIYVVVNGCINENDRAKLLTIANRVDIRENYGFDAYAYKRERYGERRKVAQRIAQKRGHG